MGFEGFPRKLRYTPVPNQIFGSLLADIDDLVEMKCLLRFLWMLHQKKGFPRTVSLAEFFSDPVLAKAVRGSSDTLESKISHALCKAVDRGVLLSAHTDYGGTEDTVYLLNTEPDRKAMDGIESASFVANVVDSVGIQAPPKPNIFGLYEDNIGMLSAIITEELKEAEALYPQSWIEDAFREAVRQNKRSWRYICAILERWEREGKNDGGLGRHTKADGREGYLGR